MNKRRYAKLIDKNPAAVSIVMNSPPGGVSRERAKAVSSGGFLTTEDLLNWSVKAKQIAWVSFSSKFPKELTAEEKEIYELDSSISFLVKQREKLLQKFREKYKEG